METIQRKEQVWVLEKDFLHDSFVNRIDHEPYQPPADVGLYNGAWNNTGPLIVFKVRLDGYVCHSILRPDDIIITDTQPVFSIPKMKQNSSCILFWRVWGQNESPLNLLKKHVKEKVWRICSEYIMQYEPSCLGYEHIATVKKKFACLWLDVCF